MARNLVSRVPSGQAYAQGGSNHSRRESIKDESGKDGKGKALILRLLFSSIVTLILFPGLSSIEPACKLHVKVGIYINPFAQKRFALELLRFSGPSVLFPAENGHKSYSLFLFLQYIIHPITSSCTPDALP